MIIKESSNNFEQAPTGTHLARCIGLVDIGTHSSEWKGQPVRRRQVIIKWELPLELREDGQPFVASEFYTMSLSEKANLRHALVNWRGRDFTHQELMGFELKTILDVPCQITITQNENGKHKVTGVAGVPKGVEMPPRHNDLVFFDLDAFDQPTFTELSDGLKKLIVDSEEYETLSQEVAEQQEASVAAQNHDAMIAEGQQFSGPPNADDDIPF